MLQTYYNLLANWLYLHPALGGLLTFVIAMMESIVLIGSLIPGSITMTAIGILIGSGVLPIMSTLIWAIAGAIAGDGISFGLGYYFRENIRYIWPFQNHPRLFIRGQSFVLKYGSKSIFIGRFVGPLRAIVPVITGMFGMNPKTYFTASLVAAIFWAPAYLLPGILLGAVSLEMPPNVAVGLILSILAALTLIWLLLKSVYYIYQRTHEYLAQKFDAYWLSWQKQPVKRWFCYILRYADRPNRRGQILTAFVLLCVGILFCLVFMGTFYSDWFLRINTVVFHLFRGIRTTTLDSGMIVITALGKSTIMIPLMLVMFGFFVIQRHYKTAIHILLSIAITSGSIWFFKTFFFETRPVGTLYSIGTSSFPSAHATLAFAWYGFLAFLIVHHLKTSWLKRCIYGVTFSLCTLVGISRLYLGVHWFTDVIAGALLGFFCFGIVVVSYRRYHIEFMNLTQVLLAILLSVVFFSSVYLYSVYPTNQYLYQARWPIHTVTEQAWREGESKQIPMYRYNRLMQPVELLNVQWVGQITDIKQALKKTGWQNIRKHSYLVTLEQVVEQDVKRYRTLLPVLFDDQIPALEMVKWTDGDKIPYILRLWASHIYLTPQRQPLWIGTLHRSQLVHHFSFKHKITVPEIEPAQLSQFVNSLSSKYWGQLHPLITGQGQTTNAKSFIVLIQSLSS